MKHSFFLAVIVIGLLTGCSSAYKSSQTPDDVYYSPAQGSPESVVAVKQQDRYEQYMNSNDERYLSMKVHNYNLWSPLDDYSYWYDSRYNYFNQSALGYNNYMYNYMYGSYYYPSYYSGNYYWGSWYNPVYVVACYKNPKVSYGSTSGSNITAYQNKNYNNSNYTYYNPKSTNNQNSSNTNSFGTLIRRTFTPSPYTSSGNTNSSNNSSYNNPVRVFTPSNSSGTTSSSTTTSSSAGGSSGGYSSTGSNTSSGRGSRGNQ